VRVRKDGRRGSRGLEILVTRETRLRATGPKCPRRVIRARRNGNGRSRGPGDGGPNAGPSALGERSAGVTGPVVARR
jgi:hypothetical protein